MEIINYDTIRSAVSEAFPEFNEEYAQKVTVSLLEHLYEYAKGLIYEENELAICNEVESMVFENEQDTKKLFDLLQKKLSSLPIDEQQAIQSLIMKELIERGHQLFKAVNDGR